MSYHGQPSEHAFRVALGYLGPTRIELIEVEEGDTIYRDFIAKHGYGVQHWVCWWTTCKRRWRRRARPGWR
jgi:hypothetical protein